MGNTPNNNFPYPESSDLVKDGAQNIEDLAAAIDTKLGVYATPGLIKIASLSFSGVASQAITPVFSATYTSYRIVLTLSAVTADAYLYIRMRSGGTDAATNYAYANNYTTTGSVNIPDGGTGATDGFNIGTTDLATNNASYSYLIDVHNPFVASITTAVCHGANVLQDSRLTNVVGAFWHTTASSYDGFNIRTNTGNITGKVQVYGYNQ